MNKTILIDSRIAIREAVASILIKNSYDVVETTYIENLFDLNRITYNNRVDLTNIIIAGYLINNSVKETVKRVMDSTMYKDIPIYVLTLDCRNDDQDTEVGYTAIANGLLNDTREFYITKYKDEDDV